jgi:hypothetical protein
MSGIVTVIDCNYYALKSWERLLEKLRWLLIDTGRRIEFQVTADPAGPLSVVIIYDECPFKGSDIVGIRGKSHLQVVSDIFNSICPATPKITPDVTRHARKQRKNAAARGKGAV